MSANPLEDLNAIVPEAEQHGLSADWQVTDEESLTWALRMLGDAEADLAENKLAQAPMVEALERRLEALRAANDAANERLRKRAAFFRGHVVSYAKANRDALLGKGRSKTRDFGVGKVRFAAGFSGFRWRQDMDPTERSMVLRQWAVERTSPSTPLTNLMPVVDLDAVKEYAERTGWKDVPPPGLEYIPEGRESVTVKTPWTSEDES